MTEPTGKFPTDAPEQLKSIVPTAIAVVTDPRRFFASMPKEGGFEAPGAFALVMLVAYGAIFAVLSLIHLTVGGFFASLILMPILGAIGLFIGAAIVFFVSNSLGGQATYESSFRIVAYSSAIAPIQSVAQIVPYLPILVSAYGFYVAIVAVIAVHQVPEQKAWRILGGIAAVLLVLSLLATMSGRRIAARMEASRPQLEEFSQKMQKQAEEMQKAAEKMKQELQKQQEEQPNKP
jgi:hypothetical protein